MLTTGMSIVPLVVCHVDTHRIITHGLHVVNSHVSVLLLVAEHRIFTCDKRIANDHYYDCRCRIDGKKCSFFLQDSKREREREREVVKIYQYSRWTCMKTIWERGEKDLCTNVKKSWEPANKRENVIAMEIIAIKLKEAKSNTRVVMFGTREEIRVVGLGLTRCLGKTNMDKLKWNYAHHVSMTRPDVYARANIFLACRNVRVAKMTERCIYIYMCDSRCKWKVYIFKRMLLKSLSRAFYFYARR